MNLHRDRLAHSALLTAVCGLMAAPAAAAVQPRVTVDREVVQWRQEHTLNLLVDFIRPEQPMICPATEAVAGTEPTTARAHNVHIELRPEPILRETWAPGFPPMGRHGHSVVYAGPASAVLLRLRIAPAGTGEFLLGRLRISYDDPDTGLPGTHEQDLRVTMQFDEQTARQWYGGDVAATDFAMSSPSASVASSETFAEAGQGEQSLEPAGSSLSPLISEPDPRVSAFSERVMRIHSRRGRVAGNPADDISIAACLREQPFSVVLDPGHAPTGETQGRPGRKAMEAVHNDRIAVALQQRLRSNLGLDVFISRDGPDFLPMRERIESINDREPDLVISLHHDNVSPSRQKWRTISDTRERTCAEYEGFSIYTREHGSVPSNSFAAARFIADELLAQGRPIGRFFELGDPGTGVYDGSGLQLLNGMRQSAILVELGYLCNPKERTMVERERFVQGEARMLTRAIRRYVASVHCASGPN